jgi:uncharacterized surface protein with fasciclin (FAS1) repeats
MNDGKANFMGKNIKAMKTKFMYALIVLLAGACSQRAPEATTATEEPVAEGQSAVQDNESQKNIVQTAVASPQHKTLVAALKAISYVDALSNAGPFTVFAPNDDAFAKLPEGTLNDLLKPENKSTLQDILEYHVYVGVIRASMVNGSMTLNEVNGKNVTLSKEGDQLLVNGTKILATVDTSNGVIYVIDNVLSPAK